MLYTLEDRKKAAEYCLMIRLLRPAGFWGILFGVLALFIGYAGTHVNPINWGLVIIGCAMIAQGIIIYISPSPAMLLAEGIEFIILACWNIFIILSNGLSGAASTGPSPVIVIIQVVCGGSYIKKYYRLRGLRDNEPSPQDIQDTQQIIKDTFKGNVKRNSDAVSFQTSMHVWKGKIMPDAIMLVDTKGRDLILAGKDEFHFESQGKVLVGKSMKASIRCGEYKWSVQIDPVSFERIDAWYNNVQPQPMIM